MRTGGWKKEKAELASSECGWVVFSRSCRAGEAFNLRTAKYQGPILLVKEAPVPGRGRANSRVAPAQGFR